MRFNIILTYLNAFFISIVSNFDCYLVIFKIPRNSTTKVRFAPITKTRKGDLSNAAELADNVEKNPNCILTKLVYKPNFY